MTIICKPLETRAEAAWDAFVEAAADGTFFHRAAWRHVIEAAFGHRSYYVMAEQDGAITGVLPLCHVRTMLFGNSLLSNPFCVYGGPVAADRETATALEECAAKLMRGVGADRVELRYRDGRASDWQPRPDLYVTFRKPITGVAETDMKAIPRKQRAMVRRGLQNGRVGVVDRDVDRLHGIYAESVRNLGTPVFSRRFFRILADRFADCSDVLTVLNNGDPIASVLNFYFRDEVLPYYGGGTRAARERAGNDFMYWEVMRHAGARGARLFDFGRSKLGTGSFSFKRNWGFTPTPLDYRYKLKPGRPIPEHNPLNPKYRVFIETWKRLPLPLANLIGPRIVRGIG
jgi:FemAB-related protein (PEP-CTERM system-associated)